MSRWGQLWTQLRLARGGVNMARTFKQRAQNFVHRLCDNVTAGRWLRATRRQQYARAVHCLRAALDSPRRRALVLSVTGVYRSAAEERDERPDYVTDEELQDLVTELQRVEELSRATLYCASCSLRLLIDTRHPGVQYCKCKNSKPDCSEAADGWTPYMETRDVIIWRKEYKRGQGLYAYKVYGRYAEVSAGDFAAVQTDCAYRRAWDPAVAALSTVERAHRGDADQRVIHWEVMWPRLFANRDYVYVRRHKQFPIKDIGHRNANRSQPARQTSGTNPSLESIENEPKAKALRYNSPPRAKRKNTVHATEDVKIDDGLIVIVSKSCEHPRCPETKNAIRVTEYWSHMVIRSLNGIHNAGMEFVLTYYDEPAVGGMPGGVAAWATGRAAPEYLARMRTAAARYRAAPHLHEEEGYEEGVSADEDKSSEPGAKETRNVREEDMESSQRGPIIENGNWSEEQGATPARPAPEAPPTARPASEAAPAERPAARAPSAARPAEGAAGRERATEEPKEQAPKPSPEEDGGEEARSWWRYLHPFYYFA